MKSTIRFFIILLLPFIIVGAAVTVAECVNSFIFMRSPMPRLTELFHECNPLEQMWVRALYVVWAIISFLFIVAYFKSKED